MGRSWLVFFKESHYNPNLAVLPPSGTAVNTGRESIPKHGEAAFPWMGRQHQHLPRVPIDRGRLICAGLRSKGCGDITASLVTPAPVKQPSLS